jgi:hypothetical protein
MRGKVMTETEKKFYEVAALGNATSGLKLWPI